jgi:D-3-phosphoglycerate dehydrogenase
LTDPVEPLILDLLEWLGSAPRPYDEVMSAWRTSCPRLPVWEEANARGLVTRTRGTHGEWLVTATSAGRAFIARP